MRNTGASDINHPVPMRSRFLALIVCTALLGCRRHTAAAPVVDSASLPYRTEPALGGVSFEQPVQVVFAPGETQRAFVVEHGGIIAVVRDLAQPKREVFLNLNQLGRTFDRAHGALSLAFHPRFAENGFFYVWYSIQENGQRSNRLARFKVSERNPAVGDVTTARPLISQPTGPEGHDGGEIVFGPDGYLYLSLGDGDAHLREPRLSHQRIDRSFFGAIIRIDVDRKPGSLAPNPHPAVHADSYAVPPDNPFVGATSFNGQPVAPGSVRTEFWAVGLRNPWRMAFDPETGRLWCGDVGLHLREEIDVITRGGNYGWDFREGVIAGPHGGPPAAAQFIGPVWDYDHSAGISVTGGLVYRGKNLPGLAGKYLFADYGFPRIWALEPDGERPVDAARVRQIASGENIVAFMMNPGNGEVWLTSFGGKILRLVPNPKAK